MIFAANLKCHHTRKSFEAYAKKLNEFLKAKGIKDEIFVFPPSVAFLSQALNFAQGAQNFYPCEKGAFTGEIGKEQLDEVKITCVLIGHSERRNLLFEDENLIKAKFDFAKKNDYSIILCIGEDLKTRQEGKSEGFLKSQLEGLDLTYEKLIIAYEPIYSIGSGVSASLSDIEKTLSFLNKLCKARLLYGGSVNEKNIKEILNLEHCSGVLIGSAALEVENFIKLIKG